MAKVFGMHTIELRPGVKGEDFERFVEQEVLTQPMPEGWRLSLLKGDRGERTGKYLALWEIESVAARDRMSPSDNEFSAEGQAILASWAAVTEKWATYATPIGDIFTDYVVVSA
jgi:hypothetical protein